MEWSDEGARIWVGADVGAARAPTLLDAVRRAVAARGGRLVLLVCNGETVFDAAAAPLAVSTQHRQQEEVP